MKGRSTIVGAAAAVALCACAGIPRGPALTYEQLLQNTHESPAWARNVAQEPMQTPAPAQQVPAPSSAR